jgi:GT2 family glycosyltransferase
MGVSVAVATYKSDDYLKQQLASILKQLGPEDELVISTNTEKEREEQITSHPEEGMPVIKMEYCTEIGIIPNFENAIRHCTKSIIFLSDQDDVWADNKVAKVMECFEKDNSIMVLHNCEYTDAEMNDLNQNLFDDRKVKEGHYHNLLTNGYQGSCIAFRRDLVPMIIPMPRDIAMHDQWIGLLAEKAGKISFCPDILMKYRRHDGAASAGRVPLGKKLSWMALLNYHLIRREQEQLNYLEYLRGAYLPKKKKVK